MLTLACYHIISSQMVGHLQKSLSSVKGLKTSYNASGSGFTGVLVLLSFICLEVVLHSGEENKIKGEIARGERDSW